MKWLSAFVLSALLVAVGPARAETQLTFYYPIAVGGPLTKVIDGYARQFEQEHPGIKVSPIYAGNYDDARIRALAALKAGQSAPLSVLYSIDLYELIEQDVIVAWDDVATAPEDKAWLKVFYPALMMNGTYKGKVYGIPFQRSTIVLYWNKEAFKEAGLDPEKPPANWTEMAQMAAKLVKKDAAGNVTRWGVMVPSTGYPYWMFQAFARQNGQDLMNRDGNRTNYAHPDVIAALQYWRDLGARHKVMPEGTVEWGTLRQAFTEGKTAMMWHTTGNLTAVKDTAKFPFGVAMLPASKQRGSPTGGGNFYLFKKTTPEERKAALAFVKWITAPERAADWSMATGYVATRPDAYNTPKLKAYAANFPQAVVARDQFEFATPELSTFQTGRVRKLLDDAIQAALTGQKSPADALKAAQAEADKLLKPYR
ncbi:ABC transporter substrate-binding protein [Betaproteobacteria bacterium PRO7]|nr:ABC transporter substrate-binding protein [Burkholderiaceae bacterium]MDL1861649.1 ABC transporter substrate-binding protein [Betaproteobacteria bacterium PRO7]